MRDEILKEIRRLATANDRQAPGVRAFERETGIRQSSWRGIYRARWNDAVREAGCEPNTKQGKLGEDFFFRKLAEVCRHFRRFPAAIELRMYKKIDADFPNVKSITRHFGSLTNIPARLAEWAQSNSKYADVVLFLPASAIVQLSEEKSAKVQEGLVYLIQSGAHYKIGRSSELERRVKEIRVAQLEVATLVHAIRTDDPAGIELYWHRRFAEKCANGEWFKLDRSDVAAFKRRRYQ